MDDFNLRDWVEHRSPPTGHPLPLAGLTVVSIEQAVAMPFATRQLADWGARVIKIERPGTGDFARDYDVKVKGLSSYFVWLNRSKESLTLDLKRPEARDVVDRLLARSDIFAHNLAPGAVERLGFNTATLRARHPRLIVCELSGFGSDGNFRPRKAYDLLVQAEAGLLSITGTPDAPSRAGISVADIAAGMYSYAALLTALIQRANLGVGASVRLSMFEALGEWMSQPALATQYSNSELPRSGARHPTIAPYGPFPSKNGKIVYLGIQNDREWNRFCAEVLIQPALATDPRFVTNTERVRNREALEALICGVFTTLTEDEILERLDPAEIAHARLNTVGEFAAHPELRKRGRWREVESPAGPVRALVPPIDVDDLEPHMGAIPALGAHTDAILTELGYDRGAIANLRTTGVV